MTDTQIAQYKKIQSRYAKADYLVRVGEAHDISSAFSQMAQRRAVIARRRKALTPEFDAAEQRRIEQARGPYFD